jgi:hypothetical protein
MRIQRQYDADKIRDNIFSALFVLSVVFYFITLLVHMPYEEWLTQNVPTWLSALNVILLGSCFVTMAFSNRSSLLNITAGALALFTAIIAKSTFSKALLINIPVFFMAVALFYVIKNINKKENG